MNGETLFLGECPIIRPEGIYYGGRQVIRLGMGDVGVGDVGDLLAYRQEWEPFIAAHLNLWRAVNDRFENSIDVTRCPTGIFDNAQIQTNDPVWRSWCASLALTRMETSTTDPRGILPRWNAWANKSSADVIAGASSMLQWYQSVVLAVGGPEKDQLLQIAKTWGLDVKLPPLPTFNTQQEIIARIQGAYIDTKGILGIIGYGTEESLVSVGDVAQATAQGLKDTAQALPSIGAKIGVAVAVTAVLVGGALVLYYHPRKKVVAA